MTEAAQAQGTDASELLSYPCTLEMLVPRACVLSIFDPEMKFVKELYSLTGCAVELNDVADQNNASQAPSVDVNVSISGPMAGVQAAHIIVTREVASRLYGQA